MKSDILQKNKFLLLGALIVLILAAAPSLYFYNKYQESQKLLSAQSPDEIKSLVDKVGKLIKLPSGEEPTLMTVNDLSKVQGQPFFKDASLGDKVLVYNSAKKAFLYNPSTNRIIEVGPVILSSPTPSDLLSSVVTPTASPKTTSGPTKTPTPTSAPGTLKAYLYNGTTTVGLTKKMESTLNSEAPYVKVVDRDNAQKTDYPTTLIIDLTGTHKTEAENLAKAIGGEVSSLPAGETKPQDSDLLIIVGADKK